MLSDAHTRLVVTSLRESLSSGRPLRLTIGEPISKTTVDILTGYVFDERVPPESTRVLFDEHFLVRALHQCQRFCGGGVFLPR